MNLDKKNVFTLQTAPGYTAFTEYFDAVGYEPYLNDDKTDCITEKLDVFSRNVVTHSETTSPLNPFPPREEENPPSERGSQ